MAAPDLWELTNALAAGFEALLVEVRRQNQIEKALRERLDYAREVVCSRLCPNLAKVVSW